MTERSRTGREAAPDADSFFLPDLCRVQPLFLLVMFGELLALLLTLTAAGLRSFDWQRFAMTSLYVQWAGLLSAAGLCQLRRMLRGWRPATAAALCFGWVLLATALVALGSQWLLNGGLQGAWRLDGWQLAEQLLMGAVVGGIALRYFYLAQALRRRQRAELEARIEALQARIRPHFLFNTMNSIASLIAIDAQAAEAAVEDLAALFRASLAQSSAEVTLAEELELCRRYLQIEQLRLGARLQVVWRMEDLPDDLPIPALSLQPLLENAVYHGVQARPEGGVITVGGELVAGEVRLRVCNPLPQGDDHGHRGNRMALANIGDRLHALYGDDATLTATEERGEFCAELRYRPRLETN
jgi:two-component system sensor histidine kinase AlgZ